MINVEREILAYLHGMPRAIEPWDAEDVEVINHQDEAIEWLLEKRKKKEGIFPDELVHPNFFIRYYAQTNLEKSIGPSGCGCNACKIVFSKE